MQKFVVTVVGNNLVIDAAFSKEINCVTQVFDMTGNLIYSSSEGATSAVYLQLSNDKISSGCYLVRIASAQGSMSKKIIITR